MNKMHVICYILSIIIGIIIGINISKREYFPKIIKCVFERIDKMLQDPMGTFSNTRANLTVWSIGNFIVIVIAIFAGKNIPDPILIFMGSAMGLSNTQCIFNKRAEVKQFIEAVKKNNGEENA